MLMGLALMSTAGHAFIRYYGVFQALFDAEMSTLMCMVGHTCVRSDGVFPAPIDADVSNRNRCVEYIIHFRSFLITLCVCSI